MTIDFHADDYGLFVEQSRRIIKCHENGVLNGISVITNGDSLEECLKLIRPITDELTIAVHLNFLQGCSLCKHKEVDLITDEKGVFNISFGKLLLKSYLPGKEAYKDQLKKEIRAQINKLKPFLTETGKRIRLDGHAHWHMIPVVFDALMEVISEDRLDVEYIRIPAEPVSVMMRNIRSILPFHPINIVKTLILKLLARRNRKKYSDYLGTIEQRIFTGVLLSGYFSYEKASALMPDLLAEAKAENRAVELLAHPGAVDEPEDIRRVTNRQDAAFFTDPSRKAEAEMLIKMRGSSVAEQ